MRMRIVFMNSIAMFAYRFNTVATVQACRYSTGLYIYLYTYGPAVGVLHHSPPSNAEVKNYETVPPLHHTS
jgi:hypothetical protein